MAGWQPAPRCGLTLAELLVVLAILAMISAIAIPLAGNYVADSRDAVTRQSLTRLREVIATYWQDSGRQFPQRDATVPAVPSSRMNTPQLRYLFVNPHTNPESVTITFDPVYRLGWRGPYLVAINGALYTVNAATGFLENYGENGDPAVFDGWGQPIVLQNPGLAPDGLQDVRLVSAGPDGVLNTPPTKSTAQLTSTDIGDDVWISFELRVNVHRGMTLVEVLVVLTILALLTTVAVTSSDVFLSQGRYEATTRTLTDIQEAVLGPPNARQADGTLISTGFIADVGRSLLSTSADPTLALSELWALPSGMAPFSLIQSSNDTDVVVPCGWRGPYLRLPVGQSNVRDGWGNAMNLFTDLTGDPAAVGNPILAVSSSGGDTSPYNAPLEVNLAPSQIAVGGNVYVLDSNGNPGNPSSASAIQVWIYGPNPNTGLLLETQCNTTAAANGVVSYSIPTGVYVYAPGFLRAYLGDRSTLPPVRRSAIVRFQRSDVINLSIQ